MIAIIECPVVVQTPTCLREAGRAVALVSNVCEILSVTPGYLPSKYNKAESKTKSATVGGPTKSTNSPPFGVYIGGSRALRS